jgi:hypothetical protein
MCSIKTRTTCAQRCVLKVDFGEKCKLRGVYPITSITSIWRESILRKYKQVQR